MKALKLTVGVVSLFFLFGVFSFAQAQGNYPAGSTSIAPSYTKPSMGGGGAGIQTPSYTKPSTGGGTSWIGSPVNVEPVGGDGAGIQTPTTEPSGSSNLGAIEEFNTFWGDGSEGELMVVTEARRRIADGEITQNGNGDVVRVEAGAYLVGANLGGLDFSDRDLHGANLKDTNLEGTNFERTDLSFANLEGASANSATSFIGTNTDGINIRGMTGLREATFDADIEGSGRHTILERGINPGTGMDDEDYDRIVHVLNDDGGYTTAYSVTGNTGGTDNLAVIHSIGRETIDGVENYVVTGADTVTWLDGTSESNPGGRVIQFGMDVDTTTNPLLWSYENPQLTVILNANGSVAQVFELGNAALFDGGLNPLEIAGIAAAALGPVSNLQSGLESIVTIVGPQGRRIDLGTDTNGDLTLTPGEGQFSVEQIHTMEKVLGIVGELPSDWIPVPGTPGTPPGGGTETPPGEETETPPGGGTETPPGEETETPPVVNYSPGDANHDGVVNSIDALLIRQYAEGLLNPDDHEDNFYLDDADFYQDGVVDETDANFILLWNARSGLSR